MQYIDLQRRFHTLTDAELEDAELLATLSENEFRPSTDIGWSELLQYDRVILLAGAGAGKTREMCEQKNRLVEEGQFAFFVPLEALDREAFVDLLSTDDEERFEAWKANGNAPAWFFLDAVDELKLTQGRLDRALRRLSKVLAGHLARARVIISCRPSDWRPSVDLTTVQSRLPVPERGNDISAQPSREAFIEALRRAQGRTPSVRLGEEVLPHREAVRKVAMLPMNDVQITRFAEQSGVHDAETFLAEIDRQNAWTFARRPLDLADLIETWASLGRLGTRAEQHKANVTAKLQDDPDRPDRGILTDTKARLGVERLALALALTRTRTIRASEQALDIHRAEGVLDATSILTDWTEAERQTLLRRALFDPATYGRVRFHHRSVQEYLAACHLWRLREQGMSTSALFRLLFAERYGIAVVVPSMRAISAWLALWDDAVCKELTKREPEALLSLGDPETLSPPARSELVRTFVSTYGQGGWRGLDIPIDEMHRLAHPELAPVIRECWENGPANDEVRMLLLELIWLGAIGDCADLAQSVALGVTGDPDQRVIAIRALLACERDNAVRELADDLLTQPASWPDRVVYGIAADLFPRVITVDEFVTLMGRMPDSERTVGGFGWVTQQIVETIEPWSNPTVSLRDNMASLIWRGREQPGEISNMRSEFSHLAPALAALCDRQLSEGLDRADADLIRACVTASRFTGDAWSRTPLGKLKAHFHENVALRSTAFWDELAFVNEVAPTQDDWHRLYYIESGSLVDRLTEADRPWLETALADESRPECRAVALLALIRFWRQRGEVEAELDTLRSALEDDAMLNRLLTELTAPPERDERTERMERAQRLQSSQARREAQELEDWEQWHADLLANPAAAFSTGNRARTVSHLYTWLSDYQQGGHRLNIWDKNALAQAFGPDIANRAEEAFRAWWRMNPPTLWSAQPAAERNQISHTWIYGLLGVSAEALTPDWTAALSSEEARIAAAYAMIEINGFAPFISDLARSHPVEVDSVIGGELSAELRIGADHDYLPVLNNLTHAEDRLKHLLAPRLLAALRSWPNTFTDETGSRLARHLDLVLRILSDTSTEPDRAAIAEECAARYETDPAGPLGLTWLKGSFRFDAERGTQALLRGLGDSNDPGMREQAIESFTRLFGSPIDRVVFEIPDSARRARTLEQLVRCAYACIRPEEDVTHEGSYSPSTRDEAENARSLLLSMLLDTPGPEAYCIILALADENDFANFADRLRLLARQRAATDAEFNALSLEDVATLESQYEAPPYDRDGLFSVMRDRLEDLAYDLAHHDFTDRQTLQSVTQEAEMQQTLAWRLEARANDVYRVTREEEVADRKEPDIRLLAVKGNQKAAVEVKIADNWSLTQLEQALRGQLVGKYLRDANCKAGCLLLTYHGSKHYWEHPDTREHLDFPELVTFLEDKARILVEERLYDIRIAVFGIDLTDSPLAVAH